MLHIRTKTTDITLLLGVFVIFAFELKQIPFAKTLVSLQCINKDGLCFRGTQLQMIAQHL